MQQVPMKILQKQHNPPFQVHYHHHLNGLFHPVKQQHLMINEESGSKETIPIMLHKFIWPEYKIYYNI